jgi:hypothetical protein
LRHRINGRKQAILERRANEPGSLVRGTSPSLLNGVHFSTFQPPPGHSQPGFVAVNASHGPESNGAEYSKTGASSSTRHELMSKFLTHDQKTRRDAERAGFLNGAARHPSVGAQASPTKITGHQRISGAPVSPLPDLHPRIEQQDSSYPQHSGPLQSHMAQPDRIAQGHGHSPANSQVYPNPSVPSSGAATTPVAKEKEYDGPFKAEMIARMETLKRGDRVLPPCDRCRRLHMDCVKNLTACQGCTKKHAKCSWRDVRESEVFGPDANKVPIPATDAEREREPSVGYRPEDKDVGPSQSPLSSTPSNGAFSGNDVQISARIMAMGGIVAQGNTSLHSTPDSEYHSPVHPYHSSQHNPSLPLQNQQNEPTRYDSGPSPRMDRLRVSAEEGMSHVERAAAATSTTTTVNHPENGYSERRDGHQPMAV